MSQKTEAVAQLTQERMALNCIEQAIKNMLNIKVSAPAETTLALRSTQLAAMWLGKAKGALGLKNPYPQSTDPKSAVIENREDLATVELAIPQDEVAAVKTLRGELKKIEKAIENDQLILLNDRRYQTSVGNALTNTCNATMWLGMVLNVIKVKQESGISISAEPNADAAEKVVGAKTGVIKSIEKGKANELIFTIAAGDHLDCKECDMALFSDENTIGFVTSFNPGNVTGLYNVGIKPVNKLQNIEVVATVGSSIVFYKNALNALTAADQTAEVNKVPKKRGPKGPRAKKGEKAKETKKEANDGGGKENS